MEVLSCPNLTVFGSYEVMKANKEGDSMAKWLVFLLLDPAAYVLIPTVPELFSEEKNRLINGVGYRKVDISLKMLIKATKCWEVAKILFFILTSHGQLWNNQFSSKRRFSSIVGNRKKLSRLFILSTRNY